MQKQQISYKQFFINYGIFVSFLVVIFGILIYSIILGRKTWRNSLKHNIEIVLDDYEANTWALEKSIPINNPFLMNAAAYEARNRKTGEIYKAIILRTQTLCGPLPAVYIMDSNKNVTFVAFSSLHGRYEKVLSFVDTDHRINYWQKKIPVILGEN